MLLQMEPQMDIAVIFNTNFSSGQLFRLILNEFDAPCDSDKKEKLLDQIHRFLIDRYANGRDVLLVIDEAQNLPADALEDIRMLSNLQTDDRLLLQIMLVGQPELKTRLQMPELRQLAQRIAVSYHLTGLDENQTRRYIAYRVQSAGGPGDLFTLDAMELIYKRAEGIPRTINLLCDSALVYAYADDRRKIDAEVIEKVVQDNTLMALKECGTSAVPPVAADRSPSQNDLSQRLIAVETALADLNRQHADLSREVRQELISGYKNRLMEESKRYDQLRTKYNQLKKMMVSRQANGHTTKDVQIKERVNEVDSGRRASGWERVFGWVLKGGKGS
jgi:general secretion pathway protein A